MAQREEIVMIDDLDQTEGEEVTTVEFGFDGRTFEIDLKPEHRDHLAEFMQRFIDAGRQTGGKRKWSRRKLQSAATGDAAADAG